MPTKKCNSEIALNQGLNKRTMDESTLYSNYLIGLGIAMVIILAAAVLLILVWLAATRILKLASAALVLVVKIKENTNSIWALQKTNEVAVNIMEESNAIDNHASLVAKSLHQTKKN